MAHKSSLLATATFLVLALSACDSTVLYPEAQLSPDLAVMGVEPHVYEFVTQAGAPLLINPPNPDGGGGFVGGLFDPINGREIGTFTTNLLPLAGTNIFALLEELFTTGSATGGPVEGTFATQYGTIIDQHSADLVIVGAASTPGYEFLIEATGVGIVIGGSRKYDRDGGSSDLLVRMEIDLDNLLPVIAVEMSLVFTLD